MPLVSLQLRQELALSQISDDVLQIDLGFELALSDCNLLFKLFLPFVPSPALRAFLLPSTGKAATERAQEIVCHRVAVALPEGLPTVELHSKLILQFTLELVVTAIRSFDALKVMRLQCIFVV